MSRAWFTIAIGCMLAGLVPAGGCARVNRPEVASLLASPLSSRNIGLEIYSIRVPLGDDEVNGPLWDEVDEQQLPMATRRRLAANGFRVGLIGARMPEKLDHVLKLDNPTPGETAAKAETSPTDGVDLENEAIVRRRLMQVRGGRKAQMICTGENVRHPLLSVLVRGDDGEVRGRTYQKVMGVLATKAFPEGDGRVRLELVPEIEHGDPQRRFDPSEGMLRMEVGPPIERFDLLRMEATLSPGQVLAFTCLPDRPGSLGYQYFTETTPERVVQKLLLVRLAPTQYDDLFNSDAPVMDREP